MSRPAAPVRTPICSLTGITKSYGGVRALTGIDLDLYPGEVHAIVGGNGAGKSTLMKILAGAVQPDEGEIAVRGTQVDFGSVKDANREGIAIVFQELSLFPALSVVANLFSLREVCRFGIVQQREMKRAARPVLEQIGLDVDLEQPVQSLSLGKRQEVEIAKALLGRSDVLILDEPNSALNALETERLMEVVRGLRSRGVAVVYISHRLEEVFAIADVVTVVRAGAVVQTTRAAETSISEVVYAMIGRDPYAIAPHRAEPSERAQCESLRLEGLTIRGEIEGIDLTARAGEIVGLAGLEGAGVLPILDVIFGRRRPDAGTVVMPGRGRAPRSIPEAVRAGIGYVPADRHREGLMLEQSVHANLSHVAAGALRRAGFVLDGAQLRAQATAMSEELEIKTTSLAAPVNALSGGNQQKVVLGKWLQADPKIVLLNDPTRGVDIGAKTEIYQVVKRLADDGCIVLFTSSELLEYGLLCDRALVLFQGRLVGELERDAISEHVLLEAINTGRLESEPGIADPGDAAAPVRRFVAAVNARDFDALDEIFAPTYVNHDPPPGQAPGTEGVKGFLRMLCEAMEGFRYELDEVELLEGSRVIARMSGHGVLRKDVMGVTATGSPAVLTATHIYEVRAARIVGRWSEPGNPPTLHPAARA